MLRDRRPLVSVCVQAIGTAIVALATIDCALAQFCDDRTSSCYTYPEQYYRRPQYYGYQQPQYYAPQYAPPPPTSAPLELAPRGAPVQPSPAPSMAGPAYGGGPGYGRSIFGGSGVPSQFAPLYAAVYGERFPVPAAQLSDIDPVYLRQQVDFPTREPPGTIIVDAQNHFLYFVQGGGRAMRYGVGVGRQGFAWSGVATVHDKQEWPDWYPPKEMIARKPDIAQHVTMLQSGLGVPGGAQNPLGARAMYLWQDNKDTLYRIHGTNEPWTIGTSVSSGCIRMINQDVIDLYQRVQPGARVVVLQARPS